jgi:hypothetical protein
MQLQGIVNAPSNNSVNDGSSPVALQGKAAELLDANLHAKYYTQAYRNNAFIGSTAAGGVVPPNYSTTAQTFGLWNPAGNTKNAVLQTLDAGLVTLGTPAVSHLALSYTPSAGAALATGGISAFTSAVPVGANIGAAAQNSVRFTPSAATSLASSFLMALPWGYFSTTTTTVATLATSLLHYDFDGGIIVPPNTALWVCANILTGSTWNLSLRWYEAPI